jgi:Tol biopolymer transport system component
MGWLTASGPAGLVGSALLGRYRGHLSDAADCVDRFAWSPDSNRLALAAGASAGCRSIWIAAADRSRHRWKSSIGRIPIDRWSPDGSWMRGIYR